MGLKEELPVEPVEPGDGEEEIPPEEEDELYTELLGYITVKEADEYISKYYTSTDLIRVSWNELSTEDKASFIRRSFQTIELLPFSGRKTCPCQPNQFPRWPYLEVPDVVKFAQIEQALTSSDSSEKEDEKFYGRLWKWGVSSYSIGNLSEHISEGGYNSRVKGVTGGITSSAAISLLQPLLQGGYSIV